jgi:uncharacterized protein
VDVASLIRGARRAAGLSQAELAGRAGTSQPALARYETGVTTPTLATLGRLLRACGRRLELRAEGDLGARSLRRRRKRLLEAAHAHGIRHVRIFGSFARGEAAEGSDVDLLVELDADHTLLDLLSFQIEAESILGSSVDVATLDLLKDHVRERALREAVPL